MPSFAPAVWIILGSVVMIALLGLLLPLLGRTGRRPTDDAWKGMFYSNPADPALLVPKRYGLGYTLNLGNPWAWVVLGMILLMVAAPIALSVWSIRQLPIRR